MNKIQRVLISVYRKEGLVEFAQFLVQNKIEILSTGGTARLLREKGVPLTEVSEHTGFPEIMDGRVKTLHPKVHGGILALRDKPEHVRQAESLGIQWIDMVVVNLYPFAETIAKPGCTLEDAIENIDIGGPSMIRSAAKNYRYVTVVTDPADFPRLIHDMKEHGGAVSDDLRRECAVKAFALTSQYDSMINAYLARESSPASFPDVLRFEARKKQELRYGENPHQKGAVYASAGETRPSVVSSKVLNGKELSYNNIQDLDAALRLSMEFEEPTGVVIKHSVSCGVASRDSLAEAVVKAVEGDRVSAYGGILGLNRRCDVETANVIVAEGQFFEAIIAPSYDPKALELITTKPKWGKNVRVLQAGEAQSKDYSDRRDGDPWVIAGVRGGMLVQTPDDLLYEAWDVKTVPSSDMQKQDLIFAWKVCKHVQSNAIVFVRDRQVVGVGAGQTSRLDSVEIAVRKAGDRTAGSVMASDAFFPFKDGVEVALKAGIQAVIQPGGSIRDNEVIELCRAQNIPMIFTRTRHFKH